MKKNTVYKISSALVVSSILLLGCIQNEDQNLPTTELIAKPIVISPSDSLYQMGQVFFDWQGKGNLEYQLYLWKEGSERNLKSPFKTTEETKIFIPELVNLEDRTLYHWQLFAVDNNTGQGISTDKAQFKIAKAPAVIDSIVYSNEDAIITLDDQFTVYGKNFGQVIQEIKVSMGGQPLKIKEYSDKVFIAQIGSTPSKNLTFNIVYPIGGINYQEKVKIPAKYLPKSVIPFRIDAYKTVNFEEQKIDFQMDGVGFGDSKSDLKIELDGTDLSKNIQSITDQKIILSIETDIIKEGNMVVTKDQKNRYLELSFPATIVPVSFRADVKDKILSILGVRLKSGGTVSIDFRHNDGTKSTLQEDDFITYTNDTIKVPFDYSDNENILVRVNMGEQSFDVGYVSILTQNSVLDEDKHILQTIFEKNGGLQWEKSNQPISTSWSEHTPLSESWVGVKISDLAGIDTLDMSGFGLTGELVADIKNLSSLKYLKLSDNPQLQGTLPKEMCDRIATKELEIEAENTQYNDLCVTIETELNEFYNQSSNLNLIGKNLPTGNNDAKLDFIFQGDATQTVQTTLGTEITGQTLYRFDLTNTKDSTYTTQLRIKNRIIKKWENIRIRRTPTFITNMNENAHYFGNSGVILGDNFPKNPSDIQIKLTLNKELKILPLELQNYKAKQIVFQFPPQGTYSSGDYTVAVYAFEEKIKEWDRVSISEGKINTNLTSKILYRDEVLKIIGNSPFEKDANEYKLQVYDLTNLSETGGILATNKSTDNLSLNFEVTKQNLDLPTWKLYIVEVKEDNNSIAKWVDVSLRDLPQINDSESNIGDTYHLKGDTLILKGTDLPSPSEDILALQYKTNILKPVPNSSPPPLTELKFEVIVQSEDYGSTNQKLTLSIDNQQIKEWEKIHILNIPFVENQNQLQNRVLFLDTKWQIETKNVVVSSEDESTLPKIEDYKVVITGLNVGEENEKSDTLKAKNYLASSKNLVFEVVSKNLNSSNPYNKRIELFLDDKSLNWRRNNLSLRTKPQITNSSEIADKYYESDLMKIKLEPMIESSEYNQMKLKFYELTPPKEINAQSSLDDNGNLIFNLNNEAIEGNPVKFQISFLDTLLYQNSSVQFVISPKPKVFTEVYAYLEDTIVITGTNFLEKSLTDLVFENGENDIVIPAAFGSSTLLKFALPNSAVDLPLKEYNTIRLRSDGRFSNPLGSLILLEKPVYDSNSIKRFYFGNQQINFGVEKIYELPTGSNNLILKGSKVYTLDREILINRNDMKFNLSTVKTGSYQMDVILDSRKLNSDPHSIDIYNPKFTNFFCETMDGRVYPTEQTIKGFNFPHSGYLTKEKQKIRLINNAGSVEYQTDFDITSVNNSEIKYTISSAEDQLLDDLQDVRTNPNRIIYLLDGIKMDSCTNLSFRKLPKYKTDPPPNALDFTDTTLYVSNQVDIDPNAFENLPNLNTEESLVKLFLEGITTPTTSTSYRINNKLTFAIPSIEFSLPFEGKMTLKVDGHSIKEWTDVNVRTEPIIEETSNFTGRIYDTQTKTIEGTNFPTEVSNNQFKLICGAEEIIQPITSNSNSELIFTVQKEPEQTLPAACKIRYIIDENLTVMEWTDLSLRKNPNLQELPKNSYRRGEIVSITDLNQALSTGEESALTITVGGQPVFSENISILSSGQIQFKISELASVSSNAEITVHYDGILMKTYSEITIQ